MATLAKKLLEQGIRPRGYVDGDQKLTCPRCSSSRRNRADPCLSLTIDGETAVWKCHHCEWAGAVSEKAATASPRHRRSTPPVRPQRRPDDLAPEALSWLASRGISEAVARRNRVGSARVYMPALKAEIDCIAFPYFREGELINVKFRAPPKEGFTQIKGAEAIAYGIDDIADSKTIIIVEGELDKLAVEEAGYRNCISVPNGAQTGGKTDDDAAAFAWLTRCAEYLAQADRIILAGDADEKGRALEEELARRLGRERCWRVRWPDSEDAPCKDANEALMRHGAEVVRECIEAAEQYPIVGLHSAFDFADETLALYRDGHTRGHSTGWASVDEFMTIRPGELSVVTGIPNHGKSEFIDAVTVNLAERYGWRFALCSFENPPGEHIAKLMEKHARLPFWEGPRQRMSEAELRQAMDWVADRFVFLRFDDEAPTIDDILDKSRAAVLRHGIRGLVVDPYNEIEHRRAANMTETEYVSQTLGKVKRFAQVNDVHVWFVAHPAKMPRDGNSLPPPTLYDISGSANWANKADLGVVVHRDPGKDPTRTDIYVRKVRFKSVGKIGVASLRYDRATGCYAEFAPTPSYSAAKGYREDLTR